MKNNINYHLHTKTVKPPYYQRRFDLDIPKNKESPQMLELAKRVSLIALPFLSLYKPFAHGISLTMNGTRGVFNLQTSIEEAIKGNNTKCAIALSQTILATCAVAGSVFNFTLGLLIITSVDIAHGLSNYVKYLIDEDYENAIKELLNIISSSLYLAIMLSASLEVVLISLIAQTIVCIYEAKTEYTKGNTPETIAKVAMGLIRGYQAKNQFDFIQRIKSLFASDKYNDLLGRIDKSKDVKHLKDSDLTDVDKKVKDQSIILTDAKGKDYDFGLYLSEHGKELVKGSNLNFKITKVNGRQTLQLDFKVNHVFKSRLENLLHDLEKIPKSDLNDMLNASFFGDNIKIETVPFHFKHNIGYAKKITINGLGSILIGDSKHYKTTYDRVTIQVDKDKTIYDVHALLSFFNLDNSLKNSSLDDIERLKIGHLFRNFSPKEATPFERTSEFFDLPINELKNKIMEMAPGMNKVFDEYLSKMGKTEVLPGKVRYTIPGLSQKAIDAGAKALTCTLTGTYSLSEKSFDRVASILKMGMLSSEMRYNNGINKSGLSPSSDFQTGGADSVFTQMLTRTQANNQTSLYNALNYYWDNKIQLLFSLDLLETGTYQYVYDSYGTRELDNSWFYESSYATRPSILDFVSQVQTNNYGGNEIMIKDRIPPKYIKGMIVPNSQIAKNLTNYLRDNNLVQTSSDGKETILGIDISQFIRVGNKASHELLA